jgi:dipeptidyl aminopeptidase/acylaminoacyl peptidase
MIYHLTYLSGPYRVTGYLGLPRGLDLSIAELSSLIGDKFGMAADLPDLPIQQISCSLQTSAPRDTAPPKPYPAFIYCRGGIGKVGRVKTHWVEQFANQGYVVFAPNYRGNEGGEGRDEFGGGENEDVLSAHRLLRSLPFVDRERISIMGFSRGAINAAQTAVQAEGIYRLILWGGVSDLTATYEERIDLRRMLKRVLGGSPAKVPEKYLDRSPIEMAQRITCPILIMHATEDLQVDYGHGQRMYERLRSIGADVDLHRYEGYGHHFPTQIHEAVVERMFDWIKREK